VEKTFVITCDRTLGDAVDVEILKTDFAVTRTLSLAPAALGPAQVRLRVDRFGLSTNNISYAQSAAFLQYWEFFPSTGPEGGLWGRLPVWGFGDVVESNCAELAVGTRLFGYFPMSNELIITPNVNSASTVIDMSAHRAQLPSAYNSFRVCAVDPLFGEDREAQIMLLYPLYFTSFVVDDFIEDDEELQKAQVIISSASAKTAIGAAQLAHRRGAHVVGVTSKGNADFVRALGVYDEVLLYDQVGEIAPVPSVYVDITGNQDLCYRIHTHLGNSLLHSMVVGGTMMGQPQTPHPTPLPGPTPTFLFAPSRIKLRTGQWGVDELNRRVAAAWEAFVDSTDAWLRLETYEGLGEAERVYQQLLAGIMDPAVGYDIQL